MSDAAWKHRQYVRKRQSFMDKIQEAVYSGSTDADINKKYKAKAEEFDLDLTTEIKFFRDRIKSTATTVSVGINRGSTQELSAKSTSR